MGEDPREDWFDESDVRSQVPVPPAIPLKGEGGPQSSLADDPLTRIWQRAGGRETGAAAVEAIRARRGNLRGAPAANDAWWRRVGPGRLH